MQNRPLSIGFSQAIKFQKFGQGPHLCLKPSIKQCYVVLLSDEGLLELYQASVNWELMDLRAGTGIQFTAEWHTTRVTFGSCWGLFGKSTTWPLLRGDARQKGGWRMPAIMSASALDTHPLSLQRSKLALEAGFYGLWLENKILRVSCEWGDDLQVWMIKWAPDWQCGCVRDAEDPDMSDMWMWSHGKCGHHSVIIYIGTQHRGKSSGSLVGINTWHHHLT